MIYHIGEVNIYMERFVRFMRQNKTRLEGEHYYVFYGNKTPKDLDHCKYVKNLWALLKLFLFSKQEDRFVLHSYMYPWLYLSCFLTPWNSKKILWVIWGGDLYFYNEEKNFKYKCYEFLRRHTINRFRYVMGVEGDFILAQKYYKIRGQHLNGLYPMEFINTSTNESVLKAGDTINILVGNSADPSNNHIEIFYLLEKFKNDNIKLYVPLSYGGTPDYINEVDRIGTELFGEKYISMKEFMEINRYNEFLSTVHVLVCNHERQQALGNIFALLYLGKKVYIKERITTVDFFNSYGLKFSFVHDIDKFSLEEFIYLSLEDKRKNYEILRYIYSSDHLISVWSNIFQQIKSI